MINHKNNNIRMIIHVAKRLEDLRKKVVFAGGCVTELFITDPAMPEIRVTQDVDVIVEIASRVEYHRLEEEVRNKGFKHISLQPRSKPSMDVAVEIIGPVMTWKTSLLSWMADPK